MKKDDALTSHILPARFWLVTLGVFAALLWLLKPMLLPFVAAFVIAYFLNPVVDALTRRKLPRWLGAVLVLLGFVVIVVLLSLLIVPLLQGQIVALVSALPEHFNKLREIIVPWVQGVLEKFSPDDVARIQDAAGQMAGSAAGWAGKLVKGIISEGAALFDVLTLAVITPVVAFYLLRDWPVLTSTVDDHLPRKHYGPIQGILKDINAALSGFIRGQALVCLCLGLIYSIGLSLAGLNYGATIGIIAGFLSFVPYVGSTFVLVSSLILAFIQFDSYVRIGFVLLVFFVGQSLEGYVLTPKLVGDRVGLHPVWILFALFAGGSLLGFVGVIIAVPVAAIAGVLVRFVLRQYRTSSFFHHQ